MAKNKLVVVFGCFLITHCIIRLQPLPVVGKLKVMKK